MIANYLIHIAIITVVALLLAWSLNLALGYTGIINLGHLAFYGVGAYTAALIVKSGGAWWWGLASGAALAALSAVLLHALTWRLKGDYLALVSLGFSFLAYSLFMNWVEVTGGAYGLNAIPRPQVFGAALINNYHYLLFSVVIAAAVGLFLRRLTRAPYGRLLEATRDDALGLSAYGYNPNRLKAESLVISAAIAGLAGGVFAYYSSYIDPSLFFIHELITVLTVVLVGGLASLGGTLVASIVITLLPEALRFLPLPPESLGPLRQIIYAVVLLAILRFRPRGILGRVDLS